MYSNDLSITIPKPVLPPTTEPPLIIEFVSIRLDWFPNKSLMELINANSIRKFSLDRSDFTDVKTLPDNGFCNSVVQVVNKTDDGLFNPKIIHYNRVHVGDLGPINVPKGNAQTVHDILPAVNRKYRLFIQTWDVLNTPLPGTDAIGNVSISFEFTTKCLQFYSGPRVELINELNTIVIPGSAETSVATYVSFPWTSNNW